MEHILREYAKKGYPIDIGKDWTLEQLEAAVIQGPMLWHYTQMPLNKSKERQGKRKLKFLPKCSNGKI